MIDNVENEVRSKRSNKYLAFLSTTSFLGWTMVVYEWNVFGLLLGPASTILHINSSQVAFMLAGIQFVMVPIIFIVGYFIDIVGRKTMYQLTLIGASVLTVLTGVATYVGLAPLILDRAGTQGIAQNEQSVAATMITEEMPAKRRGFVYSFVQSGWPFGVALAGIVVTFLYKPLGYRYIWLVAVAPMVLIIVARYWTKETERFDEIKKARKGKIDKEVGEIAKVDKIKENPIKQAFAADVRKYTIWSMLLYMFYLGGQVPVVLLAAYYMEVILNLPVVTAASIITIGAFITIPAYWINGILSDIIGRKSAGIIGTLLAFAGAALFALVGKSYLSLVLGYTFASFWINGNFANVINYINESIPTRIRGTVNMLSTGMGQLGWGIVALTYGLLIPLVGVRGDMVLIPGIFFGISIGILVVGKKIKAGTPLEAIAT